MGYHCLLQGIFPAQGLSLCLLLGRQTVYHQATWEAHLSGTNTDVFAFIKIQWKDELYT